MGSRGRSILADNQRFSPSQRARRYERMRRDVQAFYRMTAPRFAADMAALGLGTGVVTWLHGDAHLESCGAINGGAERRFDFLDCNQTMPAPFEWDLQRLLVSACLEARRRQLPEDAEARLLDLAVQGYLGHLQAMASTELDALAASDVPVARAAAWLEPAGPDAAAWLAEYTEQDESGGRHFLAEGLVVPVGERIEAEIEAMLADYVQTLPPRQRRPGEQYRSLDVAAYMADDDLAGREMFLALLADDTLLLLEEGATSALVPHRPAFTFNHDAQRIMAGERVIRTRPDPWLGHTFGRDKAYVVRHFDPGQQPVALAQVADLSAYLDTLGLLLAKVHARGAACGDILACVAREPYFAERQAEAAAEHAGQVALDYQDFRALLPP